MSLRGGQVVPGLGLVVTVYDILSVEGGFIYPSDGAAHFKAKFRLVVFRPYEGEVIVGKLKSCDKCASSIHHCAYARAIFHGCGDPWAA